MVKTFRLLITLAAVSALLLVSPVLRAGSPSAAADFGAVRMQPFSPAKPAPVLALGDLDGGTTRLEDLRGKLVMVVFWHTA